MSVVFPVARAVTHPPLDEFLRAEGEAGTSVERVHALSAAAIAAVAAVDAAISKCVTSATVDTITSLPARHLDLLALHASMDTILHDAVDVWSHFSMVHHQGSHLEGIVADAINQLRVRMVDLSAFRNNIIGNCVTDRQHPPKGDAADGVCALAQHLEVNNSLRVLRRVALFVASSLRTWHMLAACKRVRTVQDEPAQLRALFGSSPDLYM
jgi:hypothetical protein